MKPNYATLDSYNQYMEETRDSVLQCPELSQYGLDEGEEDYDNDNTVTTTTGPDMLYFDADLEGSFLDPVVRTPASGSLTGVVDDTGISILVKVRKISSVTRASLHRIENEAIGPEAITLWERESSPKPFSGTLVARRISFTDFVGKMSAPLFTRLLDMEKWGIVIYTAQHPDGEISGFLEETFFL